MKKNKLRHCQVPHQTLQRIMNKYTLRFHALTQSHHEDKQAVVPTRTVSNVPEDYGKAYVKSSCSLGIYHHEDDDAVTLLSTASNIPEDNDKEYIPRFHTLQYRHQRDNQAVAPLGTLSNVPEDYDHAVFICLKSQFAACF